jgi:hypothetical protein
MARKQTTGPGIQLSRRALVGQPIAVDRERRSFSIVISTETPVRTWIPNPACAGMSVAELETTDMSWIEVDEVLLTAGMDYSRAHNMPFMDNHDTYRGLAATLGRVYNVRAEDGKIVGEPVLSRRHADLLDDIEDGLFPQISAGYVVNEYEVTERPDAVPLAVAVSWTLHEASAVPVGADPNAVVRSRGLSGYPIPKYRMRSADDGAANQTQEKNMELEELVVAAETAEADLEAALDAVVAATDEGATEEVVARARKLRKLREESTAEEEVPAGDEQARAEGDELTAEEDKENASLEASARAFGLVDKVKALRSAKAKPSVIRAFITKAALASAELPSAQSAAEPARERSHDASKPNLRSIYENVNPGARRSGGGGNR